MQFFVPFCESSLRRINSFVLCGFFITLSSEIPGLTTQKKNLRIIIIDLRYLSKSTVSVQKSSCVVEVGSSYWRMYTKKALKAELA